MDLIWWAVIIVGMALLAGCVGVVLLRPDAPEDRSLRPLANLRRLTRLPEYVRAVRQRILTTIVVIVLLAVAFTAALLTTARPTGLPAVAGQAGSGQPEDIMVCVSGPLDVPAVSQSLGYFAERIPSFGTERIGLTSANRRIVPLTRDYEYARAQFANYAAAAERGGEPTFVAPVTYADYATSVEDVLAMCLTGFPAFQEPSAQRRSLIYIGPAELGENRQTPTLFTMDQVRDLATAAGVQVNVLAIGPIDGTLETLSQDTAGRSYAVATEVGEQLAEIRTNPPVAGDFDATSAVRSGETPELPLVTALIAVVALALWPVVVRP